MNQFYSLKLKFHLIIFHSLSVASVTVQELRGLNVDFTPRFHLELHLVRYLYLSQGKLPNGEASREVQ
jgi:hypothetical protein